MRAACVDEAVCGTAAAGRCRLRGGGVGTACVWCCAQSSGTAAAHVLVRHGWLCSQGCLSSPTQASCNCQPASSISGTHQAALPVYNCPTASSARSPRSALEQLCQRLILNGQPLGEVALVGDVWRLDLASRCRPSASAQCRVGMAMVQSNMSGCLTSAVSASCAMSLHCSSVMAASARLLRVSRSSVLRRATRFVL